jgi:hypothetical protein
LVAALVRPTPPVLWLTHGLRAVVPAAEANSTASRPW